MIDKSKQQYLDFEAYDRVAEPHKRERASAWRTAIGLQDVDGLKVSDYLKKTAVRHIEGDITTDEVREQLKSYYVNKTTHDEDDAEKEEADRVAANIAKLLSEQSFSFTALEFLNIHTCLKAYLSMPVRCAMSIGLTFIPNRSLGFLYVVRQREILMTDLGLMRVIRVLM